MNTQIATPTILAIAATMILSCQHEEGTAPEAQHGSRPVAMRLMRSAAVPDSIWFRTDSVRVKVSTTSGLALMDRKLPFAGTRIEFGRVSAPGDQGVVVNAWGYARGVNLWSAEAMLPPSASAQVAELTIDSAVATNNYLAPLGTVTAPVFAGRSEDPWSGNTYDRPFRLFLGSLTDSSVIYYTRDRRNPSTSSSRYDPDSGILVDSSCEVQAIATRTGWTSSPIYSESFVLKARGIDSSRTSVPAWNDGVFDRVVTVHLSSPTPSAEIRYTLDGSVPTRDSKLYANAGVVVDSTRTLNAVVFAGKALRSDAVFTKRVVLKARSAELASSDIQPWKKDVYDRTVTFRLSSPTPNAEIRYTLDGSVPTRGSKLHGIAGVVVDSSRTLKAVVFAGKSERSDTVYEKRVLLQARNVEFVAPQAGWPPYEIKLATPTPGVKIHYTLDGSEPDTSDPVFTNPIVFLDAFDSLVVRALAVPISPNLQVSAVSLGRFGHIVPWNPRIKYGKLLDERDGQSYRTVVIGSQRWMAQNLNYRIDSSWCPAKDTSNCHRYGRLYKWSGVMAGQASSLSRPSGVKGLCPSGWHVPSAAEWDALAVFMGATGGTMLKSSAGWDKGNGTDYVGFRGLPAGNRGAEGGAFSAVGSAGNFWSSSESSDAYAVRPYLLSTEIKLNRSENPKNLGLSLRCVAD